VKTPFESGNPTPLSSSPNSGLIWRIAPQSTNRLAIFRICTRVISLRRKILNPNDRTLVQKNRILSATSDSLEGACRHGDGGLCTVCVWSRVHEACFLFFKAGLYYWPSFPESLPASVPYLPVECFGCSGSSGQATGQMWTPLPTEDWLLSCIGNSVFLTPVIIFFSCGRVANKMSKAKTD
jgi:hypothetical protein